MRRPLWIPWRWWRRAAQLVLLLLFLWLFRRTEYGSSNELAGGENLFFRLDPLVGATAMLAARQFLAAFWPAALLLALTLLFGRFFCGWICPLGTLLDYFHRLVRPLARTSNRYCEAKLPQRAEETLRATRYVLLLAILVAAVFSVQLVGYFDPFGLLFRGLTFAGDSHLDRSASWALERVVSDEAVGDWQHWAREEWHLLPRQGQIFQLAGLSAALLGAIFALEFVARRFWCRHLCPTGAVFGLFAARTWIKRLPNKVCRACDQCAVDCRMQAHRSETDFLNQACNLCMNCVDDCAKGIVQFRPKQAKPSKGPRRQPVDLSRRGVLVGLAAGVTLPAATMVGRLGRAGTLDPYLLRPPGAGDEPTFLDLCIRCGECMKVCPTNVLQPTMLEAGIEGMFSPRLVPRFIFEKSYCEFTCTLCGQVCPTGAIPRLTEEEKHKQPTGKAYFDHALCLPWAENTPCIRCEEMCPTPEKAIKILRTFTIKGPDGEEVEIHQPYVDRDLCVGCGICESNCTLEGKPAIRVVRVDAADPGTETQRQARG